MESKQAATESVKILMLGCGNMGGALLARWSAHVDATFTVVDHHCRGIPEGVTCATDLGSVAAEGFDLLILAIKPQQISDNLGPYLAKLTGRGAVLSIAAGLSSEKLAELASGRDVIRMMPNLPVRIGQGVSGLYASETCAPWAKSLCHLLGISTGDVLWVHDEDTLDRLTVVAGCGPGFCFEIARNFVDAAKKLGFENDEARRLVLGTLLGSLKLAMDSELSLGELRDAVTSKEGVTEAGLRVLRRGGRVEERFARVLEAAYDRVLEMRE